MAHRHSLSVDRVRQALDDLPETVAASTEQPDPRELFVVPGHERALDPESTVVIGDRGTGKSYWSAALNGALTREVIAAQLPRLRLDRVKTSWGFSVSTSNDEHPSRRVLQRLSAEFPPEDIWRAVILHQLTTRYDRPLPGENWTDRVRYVVDDPERGEFLLNRISGQLDATGHRHLLVFDALDRTGSDWKAIRRQVKALLQVCLELKDLPGLRTKLFMRPDMWEDSAIWEFPDSSKLHHSRVVLQWHRVDLYGLLWHWLINHADEGGYFRDWLEMQHRLECVPTQLGEMTVYAVPDRLRRSEDVQARVLNDLATPYMGINRRRGRTYTWLPTHLADAKGQVSPRSFLIAIREAQRETLARGHKEVLHWEGIKKGVQDASRIRVRELGEDYPWIQSVLDPLKGLTVPCAETDIEQRWRDAKVIATIEREQAQEGDDDSELGFYLPPHALDSSGVDSSEQGLTAELERIGVFRRAVDGRVDIPDLFRVAASIGRRGGVRPIQ